MVVLRFRSEEVRRECCGLARLRKRWGPDVARRISHRLQQLEAMTTLADLDFLPCETFENDNGVIEVSVTDDLAILIQRSQDTTEGEALMQEITVTALRDHSTAPRTS